MWTYRFEKEKKWRRFKFDQRIREMRDGWSDLNKRIDECRDELRNIIPRWREKIEELAKCRIEKIYWK